MFQGAKRNIDINAVSASSTSIATPQSGRIVVLANRAPVRYDWAPDRTIVSTRSSGGLVTALEPLVKEFGGTWVAHTAGDADLHAPRRRQQGGFRHDLRFVELEKSEYDGFYFGFANEGLWPLCHDVNVEARFRLVDYLSYQRANLRFASVVSEEAGEEPGLVLIQDYHFALAPRMVRQQQRGQTIASFWHVPWPKPRTFRSCPWAIELLDGLLGSDLIGFQTEEDRHNFLGSVESLLLATVDRIGHRVTYRGRTTVVGVYPVGVDIDPADLARCPSPAECRDLVFREHRLGSEQHLVVGVDRLDYTKGIHEKLLALEQLLETRPDLRGRVTLLQVAEPSRGCLVAYRQARMQVLESAARLNARFGAGDYRPVHLLESHHDADAVRRLYRAADVCYVGSLRDGMNLVAKEFAAARDDDHGVLVLSDRAGAAQQLRSAVLIDPYDVERSAVALASAIEMSPGEQVRRMRALRATVDATSGRWWAEQFVGDAERLRSLTQTTVRQVSQSRLARLA